jgi:hypothetical protein
VKLTGEVFSFQRRLPMTKQLGACLATVVLLGACSAARAQDFPKGTFAIKLGEDKWSVTFDGKGKYTVMTKGETVVTGSYKATKDEVVFMKEEGKLASAEPGKYKWKLDGKKLTFTKVEDDSAGRAKALTSGPWMMEAPPGAEGRDLRRPRPEALCRAEAIGLRTRPATPCP